MNNLGSLSLCVPTLDSRHVVAMPSCFEAGTKAALNVIMRTLVVLDNILIRQIGVRLPDPSRQVLESV